MKDINQLKDDHQFQLSIVKRAFRFMACGTLILATTDGIAAAGLMFALGELLGVLEELV
jgi:hypothetical protein